MGLLPAVIGRQQRRAVMLGAKKKADEYKASRASVLRRCLNFIRRWSGKPLIESAVLSLCLSTGFIRKPLRTFRSDALVGSKTELHNGRGEGEAA
jgi:hypothetical protein